jgi:hypothetical protein
MDGFFQKTFDDFITPFGQSHSPGISIIDKDGPFPHLGMMGVADASDIPLVAQGI